MCRSIWLSKFGKGPGQGPPTEMTLATHMRRGEIWKVQDWQFWRLESLCIHRTESIAAMQEHTNVKNHCVWFSPAIASSSISQGYRTTFKGSFLGGIEGGCNGARYRTSFPAPLGWAYHRNLVLNIKIRIYESNGHCGVVTKSTYTNM